jgi:hypothetical protein
MDHSTNPPDLPAPATPAEVPRPNVAQEAITVISPEARGRLTALIAARARMLPISVVYPHEQRPAEPWQVFELRRSGGTYTLTPTADGPSLVPSADGMFVYVVRADDPGRVYVGVPDGRIQANLETHLAPHGIEGHTSLTDRASVLYAGELILQDGRLVSWGNSSGHYQPSGERAQRNLLPVVQTLLPESRFINYWPPDGEAWHARLNQLRGYEDMLGDVALRYDDPDLWPGHLEIEGSPAPSSGAASGSPDTSSTSSTSSTSGTSGTSGASDTSAISRPPSARLRLRVGNSEMPLEQLMDLGAMVNGQPMRAALQGTTMPALLQDGLADRLSFDGDMLQRQIETQRIAGIDDMFFELASQRRSHAPLVVDSGSTPRPWIARFNAMLERVQTLSAIALYQPRQNSVTCMLPGYAPVRHTALGLHLFGLYNGLRALRTAVARGDVSASVVAGGELAATGVGVVAEEGLQRLGAAIQRGATQSLSQFSRTAIGMRLGGPARLGVNLARSAPLAGALITAPFDAYHAIDSFRLAGQSSGRQAQDHYVDAGLATASFVTTVGLGAAGYAGFSGAGPIGLGVGALLIIAGRTYHSVRYVEDLQSQIPLSRGEVMSTGLLNVIGMDPTREVQDRKAVSDAVVAYRSSMQQQMQSNLGHLGPLGVSHIVFGDAVIKLREPVRQTNQINVSTVVGERQISRVTAIPQPPSISGNSGADNIDASGGLSGLQNVVSIAAATDDKVLWMTGTGDDTLTGVWNRRNLFDVDAGKKILHGGDEADRFDLRVAPGRDSSFDGGLGVDTLLLSFAHQSGEPIEVMLAGHSSRYAFRRIEDHAGDNYQAAGSQNWLTSPRDMQRPEDRVIPGWVQVGECSSLLMSIENVITSGEATTNIVGNGQDNVFVLNGRNDSADGGLGDDTYIIQGGGTIRVKAGANNNRYQLQRTIGTVEIESARAGQHTLHLDFYLHELLFEAKEESVEISIIGVPEQRIVLRDIYEIQEGGLREAIRADGQVRMVTRDAMAVTPLFSRYGDEDNSLIELLAQPLVVPALPEQQRFATAEDIQKLDLLVASSGGWQSASGVATASGGSMAGYRDEALRGAITAVPA